MERTTHGATENVHEPRRYTTPGWLTIRTREPRRLIRHAGIGRTQTCGREVGGASTPPCVMHNTNWTTMQEGSREGGECVARLY